MALNGLTGAMLAHRVRRVNAPGEVRWLILGMAAGNRTWGRTHIQGALQKPSHEIGRGTIAKVLKEAGAHPAPDRQKRTTWKEFLRAHWDVLASAAFFSVEVWAAVGLIWYHAFFVIPLATREVHIAGIIPERLILIGESSLHRATSQFVPPYRQERNHQGLENKILQPEFTPFPTAGAIKCGRRLGGLLDYYHREAAKKHGRSSFRTVWVLPTSTGVSRRALPQKKAAPKGGWSNSLCPGLINACARSTTR